MIAAGVNAKALQTFMGHSSITVTLDRYGHLFPGSEAEAATVLDAYLNDALERARQAEIGECGGSSTSAVCAESPNSCSKTTLEMDALPRRLDPASRGCRTPERSNPLPEGWWPPAARKRSCLVPTLRRGAGYLSVTLAAAPRWPSAASASTSTLPRLCGDGSVSTTWVALSTRKTWERSLSETSTS
jgi:hypothetical protein